MPRVLSAPAQLATTKRRDASELLLTLLLTTPTPLTLRLSDHYVPAVLIAEIPGTNAILNGDFPTDLGSWTVSTSGGGITLTWVSGHAHYQRAAVAGAALATLAQDVVAVRGGPWTLSADITHTGGTGVRVTILVAAVVVSQVTYLTTGAISTPFTAAAGQTITVKFETVCNAFQSTNNDVDNVVLLTPPIPQEQVGDEYLPMVAGWGTLTEALNVIDAGGSPGTATVTLFNDKPVAGRDRFSDIIRTPGNTGLCWDLAFAQLTVSRLDPGAVRGEETVLGVFYLEEPTRLDDHLLTLRMTDESLVLDQRKSGTTVITRDIFYDCDPAQELQAIAVPIGQLTTVTCRPVNAGRATTLSTALADSSGTTVVLADATDFLGGDQVQIDAEHITLGVKLGATFTGCTRGANATTASDHAADVAVLPLRSEYLYAVGECTDDNPVGAVTNIKAGGVTARTSPSVELVANILDDGTERRFAVIRFIPSDVLAFHVYGAGGPAPVVLVLINVVDPANTGSRTATIPSTFELGRPTSRTMVFTVTNGVGSPSWNVERRLTGGAWVRIASGSVADIPYSGQDTRDYDSHAAEEIRLNVTAGSGYSLALNFSSYTVQGAARNTGAGSTALAVVGEVTADVVGIQDTANGTLTGAPRGLLEDFSVVTRYLLTKRYGAQRLMGTSWAATRAKVFGYRWALLFGNSGAVPFDEFRKMVELHSRCRLMLEGNTWELVYLEDHPAPSMTLDYDTAMWAEMAAVVTRTERTRIFNSVITKSGYSWSGQSYSRTVRVEPVELKRADRIETTIELPWASGSDTADMLGKFWLARWRRQLWQVQLVAYQNVLATIKADGFNIENHPLLEAHGGSALVFRITGKEYLLADENSGRIKLTAVEVPEETLQAQIRGTR